MSGQHSDLIRQIREAMPEYPRALRQLAVYVLDQTFAASGMGTEELARAAGVSVATVNRFAHVCGFDGYPAFRAKLHAIFENFFEPVEKLRSGMLQDMGSCETALLSLETAAANITKTAEKLRADSWQQAVGLILNASDIFVAGMGVSSLHAAFLADCLEPCMPQKIRAIDSSFGMERAYRQAGMLTAGQLFVAISLPRYSKNLVDLLLFVREQGCKILVLTDGHTSPIAQLGDVALFAPCEHPVLYASNAPMTALIEALAASVIPHAAKSVSLLAKQTENTYPYFSPPSED